MTLFPISKTKITLPDLLLQDIKIGNNRIFRYGFLEEKLHVEIYDSDYQGWYELRTEKPEPYNRIFLKKPKTRNSKPSKRALCLQLKKYCDIEGLDKTTKMAWIQHHGIDDRKEPIEIVKSWSRCFQFREEFPECNQNGLRKPQLGALHAISAYFSVNKNLEPATVVLPTGTGKTETMLSVMVYRQLKKILVLVPSNALRDQIFKKFIGLGYLNKLDLIPSDTALPFVAPIVSGIKTVNEALQLLERGNVFIATAQVLNSSNPDAVDKLCEGIEDLFVDEAHHISAKTWASVRDRFAGKRVVQFTATPFRNNGDALGGHIIYNYSMGEAQEAEYFRHINLVPVEEYYIEEADKAIAKAGVNQLKADLTNNLDHLLMVRADRKSRIKDLFPIYQDLASEFRPMVIHSDMSKSDITERIKKLLYRESRIVICVNMLGEGFDLPNLKIAAIHDIHKSLAITLQFIGRFTRKNINLGDASVVVNIAEPEVENGLQQLYAQDADWDSVLKRLSEKRISREIRLQEVIQNLKEKGDLHKQLSLWNLRPSYSSMLFKTSCTNWHPELFKEIIPYKTEHWHAISEDEKLLIILAIYEAPVKWGKYKGLNDSIYKLLIAHWDTERSALFVFSNDYKWFHVEKLVRLVCNDQCELFSGPKIFNIFNGLQYPLVRNLGASQIGAISFTQYFGSNVTEGLNRIEKAKSNLSNLAGLGYNDGERVIWGCSQKKGKVWSVNSGSISDWTDWVRTAWDKVTDGKPDEKNITQNFLRPQRIKKQHNAHVVAVQWGEHIQADPEDRVTILFGDTEIPLYLVDLKIVNQGKNTPYRIGVISDTKSSIYEFTIDEMLNGGFGYKLYEGDNVFVKRGSGRQKPLEDYLLEDPWILQYVDGSFSYNCFLIELPESIGEFSSDQIDCWDWSGINIKKESMGKDQKQNTVQWRTYQKIENLYDVIINDDGSGEAADLVGFKVREDQIHIGLIHCKYSKGATPGARIDDLYEVCGQAQKSIRWKHSGIDKLYIHLRKREETWKAEQHTRFLKGTLPDLANIKRRARIARVELKVFIVQPGLEKSTISEDMLRILGSTEVYLKNTTQAELIVVGSL